ncbi:DUF411 domain-containing protein [Candidatus Halobeggiatoa sp. HSG11]|nr:DUF411 domain-containing protein [Candidatus Halobeggiatoa sp. HSG11]
MRTYNILIIILLLAISPYGYSAETQEITVYRSPNCGCCSGWIKHLQEHQFSVIDIKTNNVDKLKQKHGITDKLASCHTAIVDGYVIEGHVPASDIKRLLSEKLDVVGLTVPAMPVGTPGMEMGNRKAPFSVLTFDKNGKTTVFKHYDNY